MNKPDGNTTRQLLKNLAQADDGVTHLGVDGVMRSFDSDLKVIEYLPLSPEQIQEFIGEVGESTGDLAYLKQVFDGIDGRDVIDPNQLQDPGPKLMPDAIVNFPEKGRDMAERRMTSGGELFERQTKCIHGPCFKDSNCNQFCRRCWKTADVNTGACGIY